jgi:Tol biopolymer transport system component
MAAAAWLRANVCALAVALVASLPAAASAQYFGANKVQYRALHFRVVETEHFDIYFQHDEPLPADAAARLAERWWLRLSRFFDHPPGWRQQIVLYRSQVDFEQTPIVRDTLELGTRGITEPWRRRMVMPFGGGLGEASHVIGHELVHAFQFAALSRPTPQGEERAGAPLPRWFVEGLAEYLAAGGVDAHTAMWLRDAVRADDLPSLPALQHPRYFPYRWGHAFWGFVVSRWSEEHAARLFAVAAWAGVAGAIERVLGVPADRFSDAWHATLRAEYRAMRDGPASDGWPVLSADSLRRDSNTGPAISPDGRWVAFLSERLSSVGLYVADATSGRVVSRLLDASPDPADTRPQFEDSAGAWDREGRRLAVATVSGGRPAITVFAWPGGARDRELVFDQIDEIFGPAWSPDGQSLAFSGRIGGVSDLFVYDLQRSRLRRLTTDDFADMQPAWEPDGRRIAFVSDRFTTDPATLTLGSNRVALVDLVTGAVEPLRVLPGGKHVSPQWSPDGRELYVISDNDGISNLYRADLASGAVMRLTGVLTGLSGVTASSPALSVAAGTGTVAFSTYERGRFTLKTWIPRAGTPLEAAPAPEPEPAAPAAVVAGPDRARADWLADTPAVSPRRHWPVVQYTPRLSLERLSQPASSVGVDRLRAATGTGLGVVLSDVLNSRWAVAALELNQRAGTGPGFGAYGAYLNQVHRWTWGAVASYAPSVTAIEPAGAGPLTPARQAERAGTATASYAFDREHRIELTAGISRLSFEPLEGGDAAHAPLAPATVTTASAAFVDDRTIAGPISVLRGRRMRVEVASTFGAMRYVNLLADYRRYVRPAPFYTLAARAIHAGRYDLSSGDRPMPLMHLGYPALVRGYPPGATDLFGSRTAAANLELRFPALRPFRVSPRLQQMIPLEMAVFGDAGIAWRATGERTPGTTASAASAGISLRTNLLGLGLGQLDVVRPFHAGRGWTVQFNLVPAL